MHLSATANTNKSFRAGRAPASSNLPFLVVKLASAGDSGADRSSLAGTRPVRFPRVAVGTNRTVYASWTASARRCRCAWPATLAQSCANKWDIAAVGDSRAAREWPGTGRWPAMAAAAAVVTVADFGTVDDRRNLKRSLFLDRRSFAFHSGCYL